MRSSELQQRIAELEQEEELSDQVRQKMATILDGVANMLKGQPEAHHLHSWHDLPDVVRKRTERIQELEQLLQRERDAKLRWTIIAGIATGVASRYSKDAIKEINEEALCREPSMQLLEQVKQLCELYREK